MTTPPACRGLGPQCVELRATLCIGELAEGPESLDHEATWLLGHTAQIDFGAPEPRGPNLLVDALLRVRCRYLKPGAAGGSRCAAHGFTGPTPAGSPRIAQPRQMGGERFRLVEGTRLVERKLPLPPRTLPVLAGENPCASAPCTTADHRRGSACCRDLQVEILCARADPAWEALIRSRQSPYLCKIDRQSDATIDAEMISPCGFLDDAGQSCTLHGRSRADGRPAKPDLCSAWPPKGKGLHPHCVFGPTTRSAGKR